MADNPPYVLSPPTLERALSKIKSAAVPTRFTQEFLAETLGMPGGTARPVVPFLKRIGFLGSDGAPTDLYKRFRNPSESGAAVAAGMKIGFKKLFEANEKVHDLADTPLKGLVVQTTGEGEDSRVVSAILGSFKVLKKLATFGAPEPPPPTPKEESTLAPAAAAPSSQELQKRDVVDVGMNLAYTINLNLPATNDVSVFNAIFKSIKENLLKK